MLHPSTKKLIDKLIEMTAATKITWQDGDDGTCVYDTEGYRVVIGQSPSRVVLLDAGERVLESVTDAMLCSAVDENGRNYSVKVDLLVSGARREIMGAEAAISKIVSALDLTAQEAPDAEALQAAAEPEAEVVPPDEEEPVLESRVAKFIADKTSAVETAEPVAGLRPVVEADDVADVSGTPWDVPETAISGASADAADFVDLDGAPASFSPSGKKVEMLSVPDAEDRKPEPEDYAMAAAATSSSEEFSTVAPEPEDITPSPDKASERAEVVRLSAPAARAIVHASPYWDGHGRSINALTETPDIYTRSAPKVVEVRDEPVVIEMDTDLSAPESVCVDVDDSDFEIGDFDVIEVFPEPSEAGQLREKNAVSVEIGGIGMSSSVDPADLPYEFATPETIVKGTVSDEVVPDTRAAAETEAASGTEAEDKTKEPSTEEVLADIRKTVHKYNPWM